MSAVNNQQAIREAVEKAIGNVHLPTFNAGGGRTGDTVDIAPTLVARVLSAITPLLSPTPPVSTSAEKCAREVCRYFGVEAREDIAKIISRHFNGQGEGSGHIWLVTGSCGQYSDFQQWNVAAFPTEAEAQKLADAAQLAAAKYPKNGTRKERAEFKTSLDPQFKYDYTGTSYQVEMIELRRSAMSAQTQG